MSEAPYFIDVPSGRRLEKEKMSIRVLPRATPKALERARKTWPEARADDFEPEGKLFRDKASGNLYRRAPGNPTLGGAGREDVDVWFVSHDEAGDGIVFLRATDNPGTWFRSYRARLAAALQLHWTSCRDDEQEHHLGRQSARVAG